MARILKATVRYDGTDFAGWQVQPGLRTVQGELERVLSTIAQRPIRVRGASRTDAGVHALGQVFSFDWSGGKAPGDLRRSVSKMLAPEVRIEHIEEAASGYDVRRASSKRYAYAIALAQTPDPFLSRYAWTIPWDVAPGRLAELAARLQGEHDFAGFRCSGGDGRKTSVRTLYSADVRAGGVMGPCDAKGVWRIEFRGNGFLYKMVRNITGTLVDIARGRLPESRIEELLSAPGPYDGYTAPARGLFLMEVCHAPPRT